MCSGLRSERGESKDHHTDMAALQNEKLNRAVLFKSSCVGLESFKKRTQQQSKLKAVSVSVTKVQLQHLRY